MTIQDVLNSLRKTAIPKDDFEKEAYTIVERALAKQIPQKPVGISANEDNIRCAKCPSCGRFIMQSTSPVGCVYCLQRLKWCRSLAEL